MFFFLRKFVSSYTVFVIGMPSSGTSMGHVYDYVTTYGTNVM